MNLSLKGFRKMHILVTGGAGYIGSHTAVALLQRGDQVTVIDNLINGSEEAIKRVTLLSGQQVALHNFDLSDVRPLRRVFDTTPVDAVIHFAGLKAVAESVARPLSYYQNNLISTLSLCQAMEEYGVRRLVFSSSATVYGNPERVPIDEHAPLRPTNPYGRTKLMIEEILQDLADARTGWQITLLRYFNPIGAHESGLIGEDPNGVPNNLLPYVAQVAVGERPTLPIYGNDYDTSDGTGVRDYIHVVDLAHGHIAALEKPPEPDSLEVYNLGTGQGNSVLEVVKAFEAVSGRTIDYQILGRRPGDIATCYAQVDKAEQELGWRATRSLSEACLDTWRWQSANPDGYKRSHCNDDDHGAM